MQTIARRLTTHSAPVDQTKSRREATIDHKKDWLYVRLSTRSAHHYSAPQTSNNSSKSQEAKSTSSHHPSTHAYGTPNRSEKVRHEATCVPDSRVLQGPRFVLPVISFLGEVGFSGLLSAAFRQSGWPRESVVDAPCRGYDERRSMWPRFCIIGKFVSHD